MKIQKQFLNLMLPLTLFLLVGCANNGQLNQSSKKNTPSQEKVSLTYDQARSKENTMSTLWYQNAEEAKALYLQGYQLATDRLKNQLEQKSDKPYSIVLDIDETVLDNSPYQAQNIKEGTTFNPKSWDKWVQKKEAKPVAGAKDFLQFADQSGVQIYYISDRTVKQVDATMENLKKEGLPVQDKSHFLFLEEGVKSKESRRQKVKENTNLIMLFGDNLVDFADFSKKSHPDRQKLLNELHEEFGRKFIIFPNPMYGSWESALYEGKYPTAKEQMRLRDAALKGFTD
ncbi:5'-nucleotidase, lipoprotein e(P4) family [Streptococcus pseudoporcinus]|uniref:Acid phosphatase n=1 Tax=Streptococcus pseudoporcinus TaxID=361101 RepID=A0A4U9YBY0_9STRE|nr:5'-nucleotidase, lipoprotein e(P4) family [Streptococcus pseudoporcinus]VTS23759.1 Putative acid phosphatase [Streptococcus pseudoporcinus]VUC70774.1 Putative acid phosphatase [Streptococcus pseudoporcinus]VUD00500.1 Putative acid phosphatase [Streptococcus pseudoporcinus]VUD00875.1 Putative acid phosphatase [Streptococcus pseudoporcinus]